MAQNVTIAGASYTNVPRVDLPKTGGGTASFYDVSGNANIVASTATLSNIDVAGYSTVSIEPTPTERKIVTSNGTVYPSGGYFLSSVIVAIPTYDGSVT